MREPIFPSNVPRAGQVHMWHRGGLYLCPCGFLTSGLSKVRTRLLPLNERERFIRARGLALPGFHNAALNRVIMVLAWRDSRDTGRISYVHLHLENSQDVPDERANHLDRRCSESVCVRIGAGYVTGNVSCLLHCLRYMSALVCPRGNSRFQSEDSMAFVLQFFVKSYESWFALR